MACDQDARRPGAHPERVARGPRALYVMGTLISYTYMPIGPGLLPQPRHIHAAHAPKIYPRNGVPQCHTNYGPVRASAHRANTRTPSPCIGRGLLCAAAVVRALEEHHSTTSEALSGHCVRSIHQHPVSGQGGRGQCAGVRCSAGVMGNRAAHVWDGMG